MKTIKILKPTWIEYKFFKEGDVVENLRERNADDLIKGGRAELYTAPSKPVAKAKQTTVEEL